jgi:hypothetical protein
MRAKKFDAVKMKHSLQKEAEQKLSAFSEKEQLKFLAKKYGHLRKLKAAVFFIFTTKRTKNTKGLKNIQLHRCNFFRQV